VEWVVRGTQAAAGVPGARQHVRSRQPWKQSVRAPLRHLLGTPENGRAAVRQAPGTPAAAWVPRTTHSRAPCGEARSASGRACRLPSGRERRATAEARADRRPRPIASRRARGVSALAVARGGDAGPRRMRENVILLSWVRGVSGERCAGRACPLASGNCCPFLLNDLAHIEKQMRDWV